MDPILIESLVKAAGGSALVGLGAFAFRESIIRGVRYVARSIAGIPPPEPPNLDMQTLMIEQVRSMRADLEEANASIQRANKKLMKIVVMVFDHNKTCPNPMTGIESLLVDAASGTSSLES